MGKYAYSTEVGKYNEGVRLRIELEIDGAILSEDYIALNQAFDTIEEIAIKYQPTATPGVED